MNRKIVFMALVAAAPLSVSGCQNDSAVASAVESAATPTRQIAKPPAALRAVEEELFEGVADSRAESWDAFLSSVSKDERTYLEGLSQRYFGALHFSTAAERSELISLGTPLPEEWLVAQHVSDADLRAMAEDNNRKAGIFLVDRLLARMASVMEQAGASSYLEVVNALPEAQRPAIDRDRREAMDRSASQFSISPTPFTAYQFGLGFSAGTGSTAGIPAAMTVAGELGDPRAVKLLAAYTATHPDEDPKLVTNVIGAMRALAKPSEK